MTSRTSRQQTDARATFPLVGLQQALESALRLYTAEQSTQAMDEATFRRLLGHDGHSAQLGRLATAMSLYGLMARRKNTYALSAGALRLFSSADQGELRTLVYHASTWPQGVQELASTSSAGLDSRELDDDLRGRGVSETDRALILTVLRENGEFVHQEQQLGVLFGRIQAVRAVQTNPRPGGIQGGTRWMNTQPGRTANLALVALMSVGSLTYVAFSALAPERLSSERLTASSAGQSAAPISVARRPGAAQTTEPRVTQPAVSKVASPQNAVEPLFPSGSAAAPTTSAVARTPVPVRPPVASSSVTINEPVVTEPSVALDQPLVTLARGRELAQMLFTQRLSGLWSAFSPSVRREWGEYPAFVAYREDGLKTFGAEKGVVAEDVHRSGGISYYTRTAVFERGPRHNWTLILGLDPSGTVVAFNIVPADVLPGLSVLGSR